MYLFFPILSSILYILSFPFNISGYLAYVSLVPLFISISKLNGKRKIASAGATFGFAISFYYSIPLYHSITLNEGSGIFLPALVIFCTALIPYMIIYALFAVIFRWNSETSLYGKMIIPASFWILIDYLKELSTLILPWGLAGYTQVYTPFIQVADITGIHGVTFIIIVINTLIAEIITIIGTKKTGHKNLTVLISDNKNRTSHIYKKNLILYSVLLAAVIITNLTYGIIKKKIIIDRLDSSKKINYLMVQGNSGSVERWNEASSTARYQSYARLTEKGIADADFVVWPETVLNSSDKINYEIMSGISALLKDTGCFITGGIRRNNNGNTFNSIFVMKKSGLEYIYDKKILFPYSERPLLGRTAGSFLNSPEKFSEGSSHGIYRTGGIITGFSICFESIYSSEIRKIARSGASVLINVANDSWFGDSSVPLIQQYAVIARAVENRISIIRSANSGISFTVSPAGDIITMIPLNTRDSSNSLVPVAETPSFYTKTGDWIIIISIVLILFNLIYDEVKKNRIS